ncbi:sigma-54-dependent Fis family transcriptional regulator [Clostridium novyi]|uniref:sigma-54 interaction domain-containing protein n=1 Tax=Clostridium novyi TaxID=1542 RepID=UPI000EA0B3A5|nr:sigma 54-interacting transcriptional regulator [Clostridium novyi]AYF54262.1 sigma-54-dependent Fis family transcriptional regulator [Clostridium novyi]
MEKCQIDNILGKEENTREVLNTILDISYDGIVVVNKNGFITMLSRAYADFLQVDREDVIGEHVTNVIENTRAHIVVKTGITEFAEIQKIREKYIIVTRIPIIQNGEVQGALEKVLFRDIKDFNLLYNKIGNMKTNIRKYNEEHRKSNSAIYCFDNIIGDSSKLQRAKNLAKKAALTESNVLLIGESGTGKELFAHAIHKESHRKYGNFVKVNCSAIPRELLELELFGHQEGFFTGVKKEYKIGNFQLASGGTIFLDEIGDMPLYMQGKILKVLQEKQVKKIGAIDIRVIATTNKNLSKMVREGKFREELYYRLNVININIPSLRERPKDIVTLTNYLLEKICKKLQKEVQGVSSKAMDRLQSYSWHGNVRQLENVIERAVNMVEYNGKIKIEHLPQEITGKITKFSVEKLEDVMKKTEKETILNALRAFDGNKTQTAKALNISRTTLYEKMTKHGILF